MQMEGLGQKQGAPPPSMMTSMPHQAEEADNSLHRMNKSVKASSSLLDERLVGFA
jgi:hypothetical protein